MPKLVSQLLALTKILLERKELLPSEVLDWIGNIHPDANWGIFPRSNLKKALFQKCSNDHPWNFSQGKMEQPVLENGTWHVSFYIGSELLLHMENIDEFLSQELEFLQLVCNILTLRCNQGTISSQWNATLQEKINIIPLPNPISCEEYDKQEKSLQRKRLRFSYSKIIGESEALLKILQTLDKIADTDIPVLIQGESGTGKELIAQAIHQYSKRSIAPFLSENCAAIPETLLESELFGYTKGSFTGAFHDKQGLFELADRGTLFLDEVGDMSIAMQKKMLRVLQNGEIRAVGGKKVKKVDVRIIAATNKNLKEGISKGFFREDLFYRLNVVNILLPPLRERGDDILSIFLYLLQKNAQSMKINVPTLSEESKSALLQYPWPGNIREMENEVKRILALLEVSVIEKCHLSSEITNFLQIAKKNRQDS